jgi:hypothetical protein
MPLEAMSQSMDLGAPINEPDLQAQEKAVNARNAQRRGNL